MAGIRRRRAGTTTLIVVPVAPVITPETDETTGWDTRSEMSGGYQPLAAYGASSGVHIQEARFRPGSSDADLVEASRISAIYIRSADGFQSLLYMHDGRAGRVLAFWRDAVGVRRFHAETRPKIVDHTLRNWPSNPWLTHSPIYRDGMATPHLIGQRMTVDTTDIVVWSPPAALLVVDFSGIRDIAPLIDTWCDIAPVGGHSTLLDQPGFMFFSGCDFDDGEATMYTGFQTEADLDRYASSAFYREHAGRVASIVEAQRATHRTSQGRLLSWFIKQVR